MKDLNLLVWLSQLGLTVAVPPVLFTLLGVWLRTRFNLGIWVILVCVALGLYCAVTGLISSLKTLSRQSEKKTEDKIGFNDHD